MTDSSDSYRHLKYSQDAVEERQRRARKRQEAEEKARERLQDYRTIKANCDAHIAEGTGLRGRR